MGRFAGGGGTTRSAKPKGAPKSKAAATRAANQATNERLLGKGLTGTGSRLRTKNQALFAGTKATKKRQEELWRAKEGNQRAGAAMEPMGAQRSKARIGSTIKRRK